jgi:predicted nucleotidyltransferase
MPPSDALKRHRQAIRKLIEQSSARNPRIFGSVLRGEDKEGSDLDLLVDPMPGTTLFDLGGLQMELEALLGVSVDLLTPEDLPPRYREKVLKEAAPV